MCDRSGVRYSKRSGSEGCVSGLLVFPYQLQRFKIQRIAFTYEDDSYLRFEKKILEERLGVEIDDDAIVREEKLPDRLFNRPRALV